MAYYPIFLELKGRPCLVIGGGGVACRKAISLVACGAKVTVVSPQLGAGLKRLVRQGKVRWRKGSFRTRDLSGTELVVAAAGRQEVNELAFRLAKQKRLWINVVDQPRRCSFIVPSVVRRGKLVLAISTGGASPALSKWIRRDLEQRYGAHFKRLVGSSAVERARVHKKIQNPVERKQLFEKALKAYLKVLKVK